MLQTLSICGLLLSPLHAYGGSRQDISLTHHRTSPSAFSLVWLSLPLVRLRVYGRAHRHSLTRTIEQRHGWGVMVSLTWLGDPLPTQSQDAFSW